MCGMTAPKSSNISYIRFEANTSLTADEYAVSVQIDKLNKENESIDRSLQDPIFVAKNMSIAPFPMSYPDVQ